MNRLYGDIAKILCGLHIIIIIPGHGTIIAFAFPRRMPIYDIPVSIYYT